MLGGQSDLDGFLVMLAMRVRIYFLGPWYN